MAPLSIISFSLLFVIVLSSIIKKTDIFSPGKFFGIVWLLAIGLTELKLSWHQREWDMYGWIMLMVGILSFLLGTFIVYVINFETKFEPLSKLRSVFNESIISKSRFFKVIIILFIVYAVSYLGNYLIEGFLPIFHEHPGESRQYFGVFGIGLLIHAATTFILLSSEYIILTKPKFYIKYSLVLLIIVTFITYLFILQRFNLMFAIMSVIVFAHYSSNIFKMRNMLFVIMLIAGLLFAVQYFRMSTFALAYLQHVAAMKTSIKYAVFTEPYMYVVMNLENFVNAVKNIDGHSYGYYTFNFMLSLTGLKKTVTEYMALNNFPSLLSSSYNTYSMFWEYFRDFGIWGLSLIPFTLGFFISTLYYKMRKNPTLTLVSLYSVCMFLISISFFANVLGLLHFVFNTSLIVILTNISQRKVV